MSLPPAREVRASPRFNVDRGSTDDEIGLILRSSPDTVAFHIRKLEVSNRILAVTTAMATDLVNS